MHVIFQGSIARRAMTSLRLLSFLLLICSVGFVAAQHHPKNVILGARKLGDNLLIREFVEIPSKLFCRVKHRFSFQGDDATIVTQVLLLDQNKHGNGATALVSKGGPDFNYVVVDFASVRSHGVDFIVEIYGTKGETTSGEWLRNAMDGSSG